MKFHLFVFLLSRAAEGVLQSITVAQGSIEHIIIYDDERIGISGRRFEQVQSSGTSKLYSVEVHGEVEHWSEDIVCTPVTTTSIAIGPRACSQDLTTAHSCPFTFEDAVVKQLLYEREFKYAITDRECTSKDRKICQGPLYTILPGISRPIEITNETLLRAEGVISISGYGYGCSAPTIVYHNVKRPALQITTDCEDEFANAFTGVYRPIESDPFALLSVVDVFARENELIQHRLVLRRHGYDHYLELADITGINDYELFFRSEEPVPVDFEYHLPLFLKANDSSLCTFNVSLLGVDELELEPRETLTGLDFYQNKQPMHYEKSLVCGYELCRLTVNGALTVNSCPDGEYRGGYDTGTIGAGVEGIPIAIPADASYKHYIPECSSFYPWDSTFQVFGGVSNNVGSQARQVGDMCRAPFYNPTAIAISVNPVDERYIQCKKIGGWVMGTTRSHCGRQIDVRSCEWNYVYFDGWCYYKFDEELEVDSKTPIFLAESTCRRLGDDVELLSGPGDDTVQWLKNIYAGWKSKDPQVSHRVQIKASQCECYSLDDKFPTIQAEVRSCTCEDAQFPICRYKKESRPIPHEEVSMSPQTHRLYREGQSGIPWQGIPTVCSCGLGSSGKYCTSGSCISPLELELSEGDPSTSELITFFGNCYFQNRGSCNDRNPLDCICPENYGPPASLNPSSPLNLFQKYPCACPKASFTAWNGFQIDLDVFNGSDYRFAVCGGIERGRCTVDAGSTLARCEPRQRLDLFSRKFEPAFHGKSNEGRAPVKPAEDYFVNELVTETICNNRGTLCGSGEAERNIFVSGQDASFAWRSICIEKDGGIVSGCVCDNERTGEACTCVTPRDLSFGVTVLAQNDLNYVKFQRKVRVLRVEVSGCNALEVSVRSGLEQGITQCDFVPGDGFFIPDSWDCHDAYNILVVAKTEFLLEHCEIKTFSEYFNPCGNHTNPTAGRFYANEFYRGGTGGVDLEPQSMKFAPFGCTSTECMCGPDNTGRLCSMGISGYRSDDQLSGGGLTARVCGEDTLPARGKPFSASSAKYGCECFSTVDFRFIGEHCECAAGFVPELGEEKVCFGQGTCVKPRFPWGMCEFDLDDINEDFLAKPFTQKIAVNDTTFYLVENRPPFVHSDQSGEEDTRSVFSIDGRSWMFEEGDLLEFHTVSGNISTCAPRVRFPLRLKYQCSDKTPQRAVANVTIWSLPHTVAGTIVITHQVCDPSAFPPSPYACETSQFCKESWIERGGFNETDINFVGSLELRKCIAQMSWRPLEGSTDVLETGTYDNAHAICAKAYPRTLEVIETPFTLYDCSNPVDRMLDDATELITGYRQCNQKITAYSYQSGEAYGIFFNQIPQISFVDPHDADESIESTLDTKWTDRHYGLIGSLLNGWRCSEDVFDSSLMDRIKVSWIGNLEEALTDLTSNATDLLNSQFNADNVYDRPQNWEAIGVFGSVALNSIDIWPSKVNRSQYTTEIRDGNFVFLPRFEVTTTITKLVVEAPVDLGGLQVYTESGKICGTVLRDIKKGEIVELNCLAAFENPDRDALLESVDEEIYLAYLNETNSENFIWYYELNQFDVEDGVEYLNYTHVPFQRNHIAGRSRGKTIPELFDFIRDSILIDGLFPNSTEYYDRCISRGYEATQIDYVADRPWLRHFYFTHLAPARCTSDWQCKTFARDTQKTTCVRDESLWVGWYNGDADKYPFSGVGDEGGCKCDHSRLLGFYDPMNHCEKCIDSVGPNNDLEWIKTIKFQNDIMEQFNLTQGPFFVNETWSTLNTYQELRETVRCRLPWSLSTSRGTGLCGGFGRIENPEGLYFEEFPYNSTVFVNSFNTFRLRRCTSLLVNSTELYVLQNETISLDVFSYHPVSPNLTAIHILNDRVFLNDGQVEVTPMESCLDTDECMYSDSTKFTCLYLGNDVERGVLKESRYSKIRESFWYDAILNR